MPESFMNLPVPIVFTVCRAVQQVTDGTFNILSVYDRLNVYVMPDGTRADTVTLQVVTVWTGGQGSFRQLLNVLNDDGAPVVPEQATAFTLASTSSRHYNVGLIVIPAKEGVYTITVGRPDLELLRQDFTIGSVPFPGAAQ
jgi:hypothetical protein